MDNSSSNGKLHIISPSSIIPSKPAEGMKVMHIRRLPETVDGTFGIISEDGVPFALTCERKWLSNKKGESCIPTGEYTCERVTSPKFGNTFEIKNVLGRSEILFHKGNIEDDSHGCIILGEQFESIKTKIAILSSEKGFSEFLSRLDGQNRFKLVIEYFGR